MCFIWIQGVQGCGNTFTFCHALEKKAILHLKMATVRFDLLLTVHMKVMAVTEGKSAAMSLNSLKPNKAQLDL